MYNIHLAEEQSLCCAPWKLCIIKIIKNIRIVLSVRARALMECKCDRAKFYAYKNEYIQQNKLSL